MNGIKLHPLLAEATGLAPAGSITKHRTFYYFIHMDGNNSETIPLEEVKVERYNFLYVASYLSDELLCFFEKEPSNKEDALLYGSIVDNMIWKHIVSEQVQRMGCKDVGEVHRVIKDLQAADRQEKLIKVYPKK